ncbi:L-dopachrome tautomerase yellow-e3 isoform X1 [Haematobia irritans]|uniref:L-dopachrome tautomerase yellow-e3 isoform X1 n=1 Tax=Haematobia irritans TaxID=7368 RepID=UPI003F50A799
MFGLAIALIYGCCLVSKDVVTEARLHQRNFFTLYKWTKGIEMTFPTEMVKDMALNAGYYDLNRIQLPVDIDIEYRDNNTFRTFLTIPRLNFGVPYSLATIISNDRGKQLNPKVESFPSYEWHHSHGTNCTGITSALRTYIDECRRLWVLDSGQIHSLQLCAPQILVFDLTSNELIERYVFPANNYKAGISVYTDMVADIPSRDDCKNTHLYVADAWGHGLIVYDMLRHKSWRIEHDLMKPDRTLINNVHDGIFTVSLSPKNRKLEDRYLYFHSLNSHKEIRLHLKIVNNESMWYYPKDYHPTDKYFTILGSRGTQCESEVMDSSGNLYCSLIGSNALVSWKENIPYSADNINVMAYSTEQWRFVTGLKLAMNLNDEEELWALSTEPKLFVGKGMRTKTTMYQIIGCRINNLHRNELCSVGTHDVKMM